MEENGLKRECLEFGNFRLYPNERLLLKHGARVRLTPRVLDLLIVLSSHRGQLVSKAVLLETVWPDSYVEEGNINRAVSTLRKTLGNQASGSDFIETVPKVGYRFIAPVRDVVEEPQPEVLALPWSVARRPIFWASAVAGVVMLVMLASSYSPSPPSTKANIEDMDQAALPDPVSYEPVRLTHEPARHAYPIWTGDGRIRYQYFGNNKHGEAYIMSSTGTDKMHVAEVPGMRQANLSPDGKHLLFWRYEDPGVYLADSDGSNVEQLPFHHGNIAWSADGTKIVYQTVVFRGKVKDWEIFTYSVASRKSHRVTDSPSFDADPAFSPDGKQIVFNSNRTGNFEIYLMNADGSNVRQLTDHPAWDSHPVFSPDGTQIIFNSNREDENSDLYLMNADGSGLSKLTDWESHEEVGPGCWSMDGTKIALISNRSGNEDIYVMNVEPFRPQLLLTDEDANISAASYSPDGTQLIYQAELPDKSGELRIRDVQSGKVNTLKKTANANLRPAWSPDGKVITFQDKVGGSTALYRIEPGGNELAKITDNSTTDIEPAWSPNGIHVAFVADNFGRSRLYTIDTVTGEQNALTSKDGWESDPVWSPDGSKIAFACDREDLPGNGFDICLMDADGQNEARLLSRRGHDIQPAWSPDGLRLAFVGTSDGNSEVYVMNSDGSGVLRLTRHLAEDLAPHWSPDGTRIIFTSNRIGKSAIYEISL